MDLLKIGVCILLSVASVSAGGWTKDNASCISEDPLECTEIFDSFNSSQMLDMDLICPLHLMVGDCILNKLEKCPDNLKHENQSQRIELELMRQAVCKFYLLSGGRYVAECHTKDIFACVASLGSHTSMQTLCPSLVKSLGCLAKETQYCPESIRTQFHNVFESFAQKQKYCVNRMESMRGQSNEDLTHRGTGEGLKSSFLVTMVTATFVLIRHFL